MSHSETTVQHLGIILDGNRRWAREHGLKTLEGHRKGAEAFKEVSLAAFEHGVQYLSAFVFSTENWSRTKEEVSYLMKLVVKATEKYLEEFHKAGIKIVVLGKREDLDKAVLTAIERTEARTAHNTNGTLALCFNYGGHQEILDAADAYAQAFKVGQNVKFEQFLYSPEIPPIDLLIRTSGEKRLSGFMLWRAAYAELVFTDKYWPDFTINDLENLLDEYQGRERRFGK